MDDDRDALPINPSVNQTFDRVLTRLLVRRRFVKAGIGIAALPFFKALAAPGAEVDAKEFTEVTDFPDSLRNVFEPIPASIGDSVVVPKGYVAEVLYRWGDPLTSSPLHEFAGDASQGWHEQENQAGDNHDGMTFFALETNGEKPGEAGLLVMNHEFVNSEYFFAPGPDESNWLAPWTIDKARKVLAGHGVSVVEVRRAADGSWSYLTGSRYNRRITGYTPIALTGPAAGDPALRTGEDPTGRSVLGTLNNCANGQTPWGTYLSCEENFNGYFGTSNPRRLLTALELRYGVGRSSNYRLHEVDPRFDIGKNPNEPNRFGWVVEIDPFDPASIPKKRTALGRFKHENAEVVLARDGRVVVYMGDDQAFEYLYKFVSEGRYDEHDPAANREILDRGILYVARFDAGDAAEEGSGIGEWIPLVYGETVNGPDFSSQADVLINTRGAADEVGATKMDRPEWVAAHPKRPGEVYCTLTNNRSRTDAQVDGTNPREGNRFGQIVCWNEEGGNSAARAFRWDLFLIAGNPIAYPDRSDPRSGSAMITADNSFNSPDGLRFDATGHLWIQTDGSSANNGIYAGQGNNQMLVADPGRGELQRFLVGPDGCEVTGLAFTPDMRALFVNIQHPGQVGSHPRRPKKTDGSPLSGNDLARNPGAFSRWPDGMAAGRPRSATVVVRRDDGRKLLG